MTTSANEERRSSSQRISHHAIPAFQKSHVGIGAIQETRPLEQMFHRAPVVLRDATPPAVPDPHAAVGAHAQKAHFAVQNGHARVADGRKHGVVQKAFGVQAVARGRHALHVPREAAKAAGRPDLHRVGGARKEAVVDGKVAKGGNDRVLVAQVHGTVGQLVNVNGCHVQNVAAQHGDATVVLLLSAAVASFFAAPHYSW